MRAYLHDVRHKVRQDLVLLDLLAVIPDLLLHLRLLVPAVCLFSCTRLWLNSSLVQTAPATPQDPEPTPSPPAATPPPIVTPEIIEDDWEAMPSASSNAAVVDVPIAASASATPTGCKSLIVNSHPPCQSDFRCSRWI